MLNKKQVLVFFLLLFNLNYFVHADALPAVSTVVNYNNYYYFIEPYSSSKNMPTKNQAIFPNPDFNVNNENARIVPLYRNGSEENKSYYDFYSEYNLNVRNGTMKKYDIGDEKKCVTYTRESTGTSNSVNRYYVHGCYKEFKNNSWDEQWKGTVDDDSTVNVLPRNKWRSSCISVNRFYNAVENNANDMITKIDNDSGNFLVLQIERARLDTTNTQTNKNDEVWVGAPYVSSDNMTSCPGNNTSEHYANYVDDKQMLSPVLVNYSYSKTKYSCTSRSLEESSKCNDSVILNQSCARTSIETSIESNVRNVQIDAIISYNQDGNVSNMLSPSTIFQGGGISVGYVYYNTFSWKIENIAIQNNSVSENDAISKINDVVSKKIKNEEDMVNGLNVNLSINGFSDTRYLANINSTFVKKCKMIKDINGRNNNSITTICTIMLPKTVLQEYTGKIDKIDPYNGSYTNKLYTNLIYSGELNFSATISGLNVYTDSKDWVVDIKNDTADKSCSVNVTDRLYNNKKYNFIYRPINLTNPFPNRMAGYNWYEWWNNNRNKERLKDSYSKLQYQVTLNPTRVNEIKKYNNDNNYFDWSNIHHNNISDLDESSFIDKVFPDYYDVKRDNIVGDSP